MILYIDATIREESRTKRLADHLLEKMEGEIKHVRLTDEELPVLNCEMVQKRSAWCEAGTFDDPYFRYAKDFAKADHIVIAAPFWDDSFPAVLKQYLENICVTGLTFRYSEEGRPIGMCNAKDLYYVCTAGGPVFHPEFGFGYIECLAKGMFGISRCENITLESLDVQGADVEKILAEGFEKIDNLQV